MTASNMPMPSTNAHSELTLMIELRNSDSGMIGSAARASLTMNAASITSDNSSKGHTRSEAQPCCGTQVSASSKGTTVAISNANPLQSICLSDGRGFMFG